MTTKLQEALRGKLVGIAIKRIQMDAAWHDAINKDKAARKDLLKEIEFIINGTIENYEKHRQNKRTKRTKKSS